MLLDILISVACECSKSICEAVKVPFDRVMLTCMTAGLMNRLSNCKRATGVCHPTIVNISAHCPRSLSVADERMLHTPRLTFDAEVEHVVQLPGFEPLHC